MSEAVPKNTTIMIIEEQSKKINQLEQRLAEAERVIKFYGDWKSWDYSSHAYHEIYYGSIKNDSSLVNYIKINKNTYSGYFGGKTAREYLTKYKRASE